MQGWVGGVVVEEGLEHICVCKMKKCNKCGTQPDDETGLWFVVDLIF